MYYTGQINGEAQPKRAELGGWLPVRLVALDGGKWMQTTENGEDLDSPRWGDVLEKQGLNEGQREFNILV